MIYTIKKQGESNERLISRFKQMVQRSRIIIKTKRERFETRKPTKAFARRAAIMRAKHRAVRAKQQYYS